MSNEQGDDVGPGGSTAGGPADDALVQGALAGRRDAFDALVERYQRRATSVSFRLLGNVHDALEVCQDSFVKAFQGLDSLEDPRRFGSWLLRIVTNLSLNFRRDRALRARKVSIEEAAGEGEGGREERLAAPEWSEDRPGAGLAAEELGQAIRQALDQLPEQQRAALVLFSLEQLPQKDVAEILNCSVEAVKWHVFQARRKLKEQLADFLS